MSEKKCTGPCSRMLPATPEFFYRHKQTRDGLNCQCKVCCYQRKRPLLEPVPDGYKRCSNPDCQRVYPATTEFFNRDKQKKDGLHPQCKICKSKQDKEYRESPEGKEHIQAHLSRPEVREYRSAQWMIYNHHPSRRDRLKAHKQAYDKEYCARPEVVEHKQEYYSRPEIQERERAYMQAYLKIYGKTYYSLPEVREHRRIRERGYRLQPERHAIRLRTGHNYRARKKAVPGTYTPAQIQEQLKRQHYRCYYARCGFSKFPRIKENGKWKYLYVIEHTFPLSRVAGTNIPANDISYLVLSCESCNHSKGNKFPWEWIEGGRLL